MSPQKMSMSYSTSDISHEIEYKVTIVLFSHTESETDSGMHRLLRHSDFSQISFYSSINISDPLPCSPSLLIFFPAFFPVRESGNE